MSEAGIVSQCRSKRPTKTMALEHAANGIGVKSIDPGVMLTPKNQRAIADTEYRRSLEADIPATRAGTSEEVAGLALWLVSPAAAYVTGASVVTDGGLSFIPGRCA